MRPITDASARRGGLPTFRPRLALALLALLAACAPEPEPDTELALRLHSLAKCPVDAAAQVDLVALGDFPPEELGFESLGASVQGAVLSFPTDTTAIEVHAAGASGSWLGLGEVDARGDIDVAMWPGDAACELFSAGASADWPGVAGGQALGVARRAGLVLVAGGDSPTKQSAETLGGLLLDLRDGTALRLAGDATLHERRAFATATETAAGILVAGGLDPIEGVQQPNAELFDAATRRFDSQRIELADARSHHAAVPLPSGETLLVGGLGSKGALKTLEAVSADAHTSRLAGLATLSVARVAPRVIVLSDGRILVGGGQDADGKPIGSVEWLSADASSGLGDVLSLPPRHDRAFVAMPGGGALAVGGCEDDGSGVAVAPCTHGQPPADWDAFWITAQGAAEPLPALDGAAPDPRLLPASDGEPFLFAGTRMLRFDPWGGRFAPPDAILDAPPAAGAALASPDPGLLVWLEQAGGRAKLRGLRHSTRGAWSDDVAPLLVGSPAHVVPDRPSGPSASVEWKGDGLLLGAPASVWIADTTYASVLLEIAVDPGPAPLVAFGSDVVGDAACPWPPAASAGERTLSVLRRGDLVKLASGAESRSCPFTAARRPLGIVGPPEPTKIRSVTVRRIRAE